MHPISEHLNILSKTNRSERRNKQHNNSRGLQSPLSATDKSSPQKINKETLELNHTLDQMDLTDTHRIFHPSAPE